MVRRHRNLEQICSKLQLPEALVTRVIRKAGLRITKKPPSGLKKKYHRYYVYADSRVWSTVRQRFLKSSVDNENYSVIGLAVNGCNKQHRLHRLLLSLFKRWPREGEEACHNDGNRQNNVLSNLRWDTQTGNQHDRVKHNTHNRGERSYCAHFTQAQAARIIRQTARLKPKDRPSFYRLKAAKYGVGYATVYSLANGKHWRHLHRRLA